MPAMIAVNDSWTESSLGDLPRAEDDRFERKSGSLFDEIDNWRNKLGRELSAFANSGGGTLFLGVRDDGTFDGVDEFHRGREKFRDWLEKVIPQLTDYPIPSFRVQEVKRLESGSAIPEGRVVIAIDIWESIAAPHQVPGTGTYYWRQSGNSVPAPNFFLESVRNRPSRAVLNIELDIVRISRSLFEGRERVRTRLQTNPHLSVMFSVKNTSQFTTAKQWTLIPWLEVDEDATAIKVLETRAYCAGQEQTGRPILPGMSDAGFGEYELKVPVSGSSSPEQAAKLTLQVLTASVKVSSDTFASEWKRFRFAEHLAREPKRFQIID